MNGLKFAVLPTHPATMDGAQLAASLQGLADSQIMRGLLIVEIEAIRAGAERQERTMRGLWYALVKPALSRAGLLHKQTKGGQPVAWDAKLSRYLAELVREGLTTYAELAIIDGSRQRQTATAITRTVASARLVGPHYPWLILFTEKDTIWGHVERVASLYGVSAISGGGQPSNACTENTIREILRAPTYQEGHPLALLSLTDYDPAGYSIAEAQYAQIQEAACGECEVYHERLGLEPRQLTAAERAANAYEPKDTGLEAWYRRTGGVNGEPLGLELDALELASIRRMFADGIERVIDLEPRRQDLRAAYVDLLACELLRPTFEAQRRALIGAVMDSDLGRALEQAIIPEGLFRDAAAGGLGYIDPLQMDLFGCKRDVLAAMRADLRRQDGEL